MKHKRPTATTFLFAGLILSAACLHAGTATITVNAASLGKLIPDTLYGQNIASWDGSSNGFDANYNLAVQRMGAASLRWPGGSWSDEHVWDAIECVGTPSQATWKININEALNFSDQTGVPLQPIVNFSGYWCGVQHSLTETVQKAVDWVTYMNVTPHTRNIQYWEIGNEIFGPWETGYTDGSIYGDRFADFYLAMKAVDPSIKIGAVAVPHDNGNAWTGYNYWTQKVLLAAKARGVIPDFLIIHDYPGPYGPGADNSSILYNGESLPASYTQNLDSMVSSYLGVTYVGQVDYWMTEYRSVNYSAIQTVMYVDTLFCALFSLELGRLGWKGANPWDLKNGVDGSTGGDFGMLRTGGAGDAGPANSPRPTYYLYPMLTSIFGRQMVAASSNNSGVKAYAATDSSGNLTLCLMNLSDASSVSATVNVSGFSAPPQASLWMLEPAGTWPSGTGPSILEKSDLMLNGVTRPAVASLPGAGLVIPSGSSFAVNLPPAGMAFLRLPQTPYTATVTPSFTPTATASPTQTATPSATETFSASPTPTETATHSDSPTPCPACSPTETATTTPTETATPSASPSPTASVTLSPSPSPAASHELKVLEIRGVPNPGAVSLSVQLAGPCELLDIRIYTTGNMLVASEMSGPWPQGWNSVPLPAAFKPKAGQGLYYVKAVAWRGAQASPARAGRIFWTR